jgi:LuxR family maltose regulon positive regulatory protein
LLRSWASAAGLGGRAATVSVARGEQDPQRFWIAVADGLRGATGLVRPLTAAPDLDGWAIVERLLEDLAGLEEQAWLVIDDLHELGSAEAVSQLELLVLRAPPPLRFVFASRHDVRLGLHRLRLEGELAEIRGSDLRFTLEEARALFQAAGVKLPDTALAVLHERTEGWAAGLRLAALSLAGHPDPDRFAAEFCGSERTVAGYLLAEVLERQSEDVRRLLLRTSVCERVNGELADLLTGQEGGERLLQRLEAANAFVVSLDARRFWFRYHSLFADLLRLELRQTAPTEVPGLHRAAAGWFAGHGHPVEAVRHAQAAQDWGLAGRLLSDRWVDLDHSGQAATARQLLARFPADMVGADAELAALTATAEVSQGSLEAAERFLARAAQGTASMPADRRGRFQARLAMVRLALAERQGDLPAVSAAAGPLLAAAADAGQLDVSEELRALALIRLGTAELWALQAGDAERHLEEGAALACRLGRPWLEVRAMAHGAWAASFRSSALSVERSMRAIELAREHGWTGERVVAMAYATLGGLRAWQVRLGEAEELLERAGRALRAEVEPAAGVVFHQARGMLEVARGRDDEALAAFGAAEKLAGRLVAGHPRATPMRAHMLLALTRMERTERAESAFAKMDEEQRDRGAMRIALAALRLAKGDPRAAADALAPVVDGAAPVTHPGWVTQAFLLEAIARDALGDPAAAGRALEHALDVAEPDDLLFAFLLHPAPKLLQRHAWQGTGHAALISRILRLPPGPGPGPGGTGGGQPPIARGGLGGIVPPRRAEPLSQAEIRVLRYLPTSLTMQEIAGQLYVSVNTVRTHTRHIYEKLGAHSRHEVVDAARALGLSAPAVTRPQGGNHRSLGKRSSSF